MHRVACFTMMIVSPKTLREATDQNLTRAVRDHGSVLYIYVLGHQVQCGRKLIPCLTHF